MSLAEGYQSAFRVGFLSACLLIPSLFFFLLFFRPRVTQASYQLRDTPSANNCLRIEFTYHRAVHTFRLEKVFLNQKLHLAMNLLGPYVRKCRKICTLSSSIMFLPLLFFFTELALLTRSIKNYVQMHFRCALVSTEYK